MKPLIIDVREPSEYSTGHVEGAINIPPSELLAGAKALHDYPKDTPIILYCRSGSRSQVAINLLRQQGFTDLTNGVNQQNVEKTFR
ncbi:MAG TPA: rhodanese-like domain-containing protein [Candidatus Saccharibacteria bacterium]|nr:rhodanese-like domain-containing protein [Candidatus Saccharibacteria bacterium]